MFARLKEAKEAKNAAEAKDDKTPNNGGSGASFEKEFSYRDIFQKEVKAEVHISDDATKAVETTVNNTMKK